MGAGHFIYIPTVIMIGIVIGWILGSRAARDAFAAELRRREQAEAKKTGKPVVGNRSVVKRGDSTSSE